MSKERQDKRRIINKMPDKETLEEFVQGLHGTSEVVFNIEKGEFEWNPPRSTPTENDK